VWTRFIIRIVSPALLLGILWWSPAKADSVSSDLVKEVQPATVMISVFDRAGNKVAQGSGFLFRYYGHLITNYHVLGNAVKARVRTPDGTEFNIKSILAEDRSADLVEALVDISYGSLPYLIPADTAPAVGDPVMVIGSPLGVDKVVSRGNVQAVTEVGRLGKCIMHSAHSFPGSSGSPVVNTRGEVIGIATATVIGKPDINFAIPVDRFAGLSPNFRELQIASTAKPGVQAEVGGSKTQSNALQKDIQMAESGDPGAQVRVALRYEQGQGMTKNCFEALSLYRKAADQGYLQAEYHLGRMYHSGECMGQNLSEAAKWFKTAAERGFPDAQRDFGSMYYNGEGVPREPVTACMWMILAVSRGNGEAKNVLKLMAAELTQDEFAMAREKARNWKPTP